MGSNTMWRTPAIAAVMLWAGTAVAQTQTIAGAHQFLSITAAQQTTKVDSDWGEGVNAVWGTRTVNKCEMEYYYDNWGTRQGPRNRCWKDDETAKVTRPAALLTAATRKSDCVTEIAFSEASEYAGNYKIPPLGAAKATLDWAKIAKVKQDGPNITVSPSVPALTFRLSSEDLATRTAFAMEFIRQSCDPAAETGF